ncbi:hypothetical protein GPECTOR_13g788 [Gonium pectorale]|uniref:Uncharacterized protein n=1 Tax=Gonium pectorale TaxID=33097 RepID=A0A150GND1_GONPE|nr:hypothetical protein GPECTOR_13g788 [Gonium pectorale]|eukprot:KXZ51301.1 hypothetical protein GPECTOR_13g788 [Gonium pectorale]
MLAQLLALALAFAARPLYERLRSGLLNATMLAPVLGSIFAAARVPAGLLALGGAGYFGNMRQRLAVAAYFGWKPLAVLRSAVCKAALPNACAEP